jgi:hypothetical protein
LVLILCGCGDGNKAPAQSSNGESKKAVSAALDAVKKGGAEAFAAAIQGKTSAELAGLFDSDLVAPASDFRYDLNEAGDGIILTAYTGTSKILIYPAEIEGYPVVKILVSFPKEVRPVALVIPEGVRECAS